jgi:hypothetical protein
MSLTDLIQSITIIVLALTNIINSYTIMDLKSQI